MKFLPGALSPILSHFWSMTSPIAASVPLLREEPSMSVLFWVWCYRSCLRSRVSPSLLAVLFFALNCWILPFLTACAVRLGGKPLLLVQCSAQSSTQFYSSQLRLPQILHGSIKSPECQIHHWQSRLHFWELACRFGRPWPLAISS